MTFSAVPSLLAALAAFGLAALLVSRRPRRPANVAFALALAGLGVGEIARFAVLVLNFTMARMLWAQVPLVTQMLAVPAWLAFSVTLAEADPRAQLRGWLLLIGAASVASLVVVGLAFVEPLVLSSPPPPLGAVLVLSRTGKIAVVLALLTSVFVMFRLESILRNTTGVARWTIKYLVLGVLALCGIEVFFDSQRLLYRSITAKHLPAQSALTALSLGLIAFCIVRHRLLDVNVFVSRHVVFSSVTMGVAGLYLLGLGVIGELMRRFDIHPDFLTVSVVVFLTGMALVIGLLSGTLRRRLRHAIATHFYDHKYDYRREWAEFTHTVTAVSSVKAVPRQILAWVTDTLGTTAGALWLLDGTRRWRLAAAIGVPDEALSLGIDPDLLLDRVRQGQSVIVPEGGLFPSLGASAMRNHALPVLVPLIGRGEILGLLGVGLPMGGRVTLEDEDLLTTAGAQAVTVVLNARLSEELARSREMEAFHKLSSFIVHDLKNAVAMLSMVTQNAKLHGGNPDFQRDAFQAVEDSVRQMRRLIGRLSGIPKQAALSAGSSAMNQVVQETLTRSRTAAEGRVRIKEELDPAAGSVAVAEDDARAIVSNLVLNALEATPNNGEVHVMTSRHEETVTVTVSDTGYGMSEAFIRDSLFVPFRTTKSQGLGVGLFQVKTIIDGAGGRIRVESREGIGTTFSVDLPAVDAGEE
jgi:hypothetical protein